MGFLGDVMGFSMGFSMIFNQPEKEDVQHSLRIHVWNIYLHWDYLENYFRGQLVGINIPAPWILWDCSTQILILGRLVQLATFLGRRGRPPIPAPGCGAAGRWLFCGTTAVRAAQTKRCSGSNGIQRD